MLTELTEILRHAIPDPQTFGLFFLGILAGRLASIWSCQMLSDVRNVGLIQCPGCGIRRPAATLWLTLCVRPRCVHCAKKDSRWPVVVMIATGVLFSMFGWLLIRWQCQTVSEVRPAIALEYERLPFHLLLLFLMLMATMTDLIDYSIPDLVTYGGTVIAILTATLTGELQMIHVWVSWDNTMVSLYGPYLPEWMKNHQHLHGIVWSTAGMLTGAGVTWAARLLAGWILGYPAIGFGDVTLMAMIGAFLGWQPTLCVLAIAPLAGMILGTGIRLVTGRSFVAFGPYLTFAALIVMCSWRFLWEVRELRTIFSHGPTVAGLVAGSLAALSLLLGGLRIFREVPIESIRR